MGTKPGFSGCGGRAKPIPCTELSSMWTKGTLTKENIEGWLSRELKFRGIELTPDEFGHVADCMFSIHQWYHGRGLLGSFLTAVVKNDFVDATTRADDTNRRVLPEYARFLYNLAPGDYKQKAKVEGGE